MHAAFATLRVIAAISARNLLSNRWKTLIVGGVIGSGALLVVLGASVLDGVDRAMQSSIVGSSTGHLQVYSASSRGELDLLGGGAEELAPLPSFAKIRSALESVPNVRALVPMGVGTAHVNAGNALDQALARLRRTATPESGSPAPAGLATELARVRTMVERLHGDQSQLQRASTQASPQDDGSSILLRATSNEFWSGFEASPLERLEFLENRVAPLMADADAVFLRYLGTDLQAFSSAFDRMVIVDGEKIPPGRRGFLLSKFVYEDQLKVKAARGLDKIRAAKKDRGATIAADPELSRLVSENIAAAPELLAELDDTRAAAVTRALADHLRSAETDLEKLLSAFLRTDDASFDERYRVFYSVLAPHLDLYRVHLGDTITLRSTTRDGYSVSTNLKVYGTYAFRGLELSPQAGALCLTDLVSFRALAGLGADDHRPELEALRAASGAKDLSREDVEANLFGAAALDAESGPAEPAARPELDLSALKGARARHESAGDALGPSTTGDGAVLSVAVLLRDDTQLSASARAIEAAGHRSGLELKAASWKEASGMLGRFTSFVRVVLFAAVAIAFAVALLVINNALVMATLERVRELGTLRAIGAQRSFVLTMLVLESGISGLLFGALGAGAAVAILAVLSKTGIPAHTEALTFLFSGPRLFPSVAGQGLAIALAGVLSVSIASGVYPGLIAMRVSPREAIQSEE